MSDEGSNSYDCAMNPNALAAKVAKQKTKDRSRADQRGKGGEEIEEQYLF